MPNGKRSHLYPVAGCPGLHLYASAAGARIWKFRYNFAGRRNLEIDLGAFPHVTHDAAKDRAGRLYRAVKIDRRDPRFVELEDRPETTFRDVVEHYVTGLCETTQRNLKSKFLPLLDQFGHVRAAEVSRRAVFSFMSARWTTKVTTARLIARNITAAYNRALDVDRGLPLPPGFEHPFQRFSSAFQRPKDWVPRSRKIAYEDDELERIFRAFRLGERDPDIATCGVLCLELTLLTGARPSEIESLRWDEIKPAPANPDARVILKPWHKTKGKTEELRRIRVATRGVAVLERAKEEARRLRYQGPYVFPAKRIQKNNAIAPHFTSSWSIAQTLGEKVGLKISPGSFRSAYINHTLSACEAGGRDFSEALKMVAENVSHRDVRVTLKHYLTGRTSKADEAAQIADEAFGRYIEAA